MARAKKAKKENFIDSILNFNYKRAIKDAKTEIVYFFKNNKQFLCYVLLNLISCLLLRVFTIGAFWQLGATIFDLAAILILGSFAYFFKPKKQFWYLFVVSLIIMVMNIVNTVYYSFFTSFASFGLLATLGQATEQGGAVLEKLKLHDFVFAIFPILFIIWNRLLNKKQYFIGKNIKEENGKRLLLEVLMVSGILLFINISTLTGTDLSRFSKQWNREYIVKRFGIVVYQTNDLFQTVRSKVNSMFGFEEAAQNFIEFFEENPVKDSNNKYTNKYEGYNVIVVHMESMMNFLINLEINGEEVTPNLNKLVNESMYFNNFYSQVSVGTSSDTEFTLNSSLMPVQSGTVFVSYYNRTYITLETLLAERGYYTFSMHANKASMWNRSKMHPSLGYKDFYSQEYYDFDSKTDIVGLGLNDSIFFDQAEDIINNIYIDVNSSSTYTNYMGTIITLSNHTPFNLYDYQDESELFDITYHTGKTDPTTGKEIVYDYLSNQMIGYYIQSAHYADKCLGEYLEYVKNNSEYDKTLFVFYGDHAAQLSRSQYAYFVNYNFETGEEMTEEDPEYVEYDYIANEMFKKVPLIIWTKENDIKGKISYPMGMIDVLPTVGNMLGIKNNYALGHDIFEIKNDNIVIFPNGNFVTNKVYYYNSKNEYRLFGTDSIIDADYIDNKKAYTERVLDVSNDIIVYDLFDKVVNKKGGNLND